MLRRKTKEDENIDLIFELLVKHFGDSNKARTWMNCSNPGLGYSSPNMLIRAGKSEKVLKFVKSRLL